MQEHKPSVASSTMFLREVDNVDFHVKYFILNVGDYVSFCFLPQKVANTVQNKHAYLLTKYSLWNFCLQTLG